MIILFEPIFKDKVWGGNKLIDLFNFQTSQNCGEVWGISAHKHGDVKIKNTEHKGKTLSQLYEDNRELFGNSEQKEFPILIKILNAAEDLSVQVHPHDDYALKNHNSVGKEECWYIIDAHPNTDIVIGHSALSKDEISKNIRNNTLNKILNRTKISKGDFFYIDSGTIHAICKGTILLEVQQSSDITYRIYDYNRIDDGSLRELHIEDALNVINIPDSSLIQIPRNTYFSFDIVENFSINNHISSIHGDYITILEGSGFFDTTSVTKGDFLMVTSSSKYKIEGKIKYQISKF